METEKPKRGWPKGKPRKMTEGDSTESPILARKAATTRWVMKAGNRWEGGVDESTVIDEFHIDDHEFPEGMDLQWVTTDILGQPQTQNIAAHSRMGWTPVSPEDFDGRFDGKYLPRGASEQINVKGMALMARPLEISIRARKRELQKAREQVNIKENQLRGGDLPVSLGPNHPSALRVNRISKSYERVPIPEE